MTDNIEQAGENIAKQITTDVQKAGSGISTRTKLEILTIIIAGAIMWYLATPVKQPDGIYIPAKIDPAVADVKKVEVACTKLEVYAPEAKQKLGLPVAEQADTNIDVLAATKVDPNDPHPKTIVSTVDIKTGKVDTEVKEDPYPWLVAENHSEVRADFGYKSSGIKVVRLSLTEEVLQVKAFHIGGNVAVDTDGTAFLGVGIGYKF
jgi:hypothetical protein